MDKLLYIKHVNLYNIQISLRCSTVAPRKIEKGRVSLTEKFVSKITYVRWDFQVWLSSKLNVGYGILCHLSLHNQ